MRRSELAFAVLALPVLAGGCMHIEDADRGPSDSDARETSVPVPDAHILEKPPVDAAVADAMPVCTPGTYQVIVNAGFEDGIEPWTVTGGPVIYPEAQLPIAAQAGSYAALLGRPAQAEQTLGQLITIPDGTTALTWTAYTCFDTDETTASTDSATIELRDRGGAVLATIAAFTVDDCQPTCNWFARAEAVSPVPSGVVELHFRAHSDSSVDTSFYFDSMALEAEVTCP